MWTILIVSSQLGDRSKALAKAYRRRGCEVVLAKLETVRFDTTAPAGMTFPELGSKLPDAVLVRSMGSGTFEAITRRLGILHALDRLGIPVWNSARAIERCVDKSMTTFLLQQAGLDTPATFAVEGLDEARAIVGRELPHGPLVLKPLFGSQGKGVTLIRSVDDLPPPDQVADTYYLQRYIERDGPPYCDVRVFVCAGEVVEMMIRRGHDWVTNVQRGAVPEIVPAPMRERLAELGLRAAAAVGADFAGVDIVPAADGSLQVIEVNSMPAWTGLQTVARRDIGEAIVDAMLAMLRARAARAALHAGVPA
ncbi:RimK family alpha-L-glutamate ligase [Chelativorans composti]|jgi:alpha-L-glutamate ligases, RimK family|uniref:RimK family alpha-L-glutamate ligase n=1 Tax=Chelativorans composti TaxID=768533 RepID=A0ABW5DBZ0_9HYPH|nr:RimK family alpha-L-glutamate ligase [bacterium SGD-2]